jgi:hypothetical protein
MQDGDMRHPWNKLAREALDALKRKDADRETGAVFSLRHRR